MRDCMQFDDAIRRYGICEYAIYASGMQEMRQISESHKCMDLAPMDVFPALLLFF